jgi:hypothetical protein
MMWWLDLLGADEEFVGDSGSGGSNEEGCLGNDLRGRKVA